MTLAPVKCARCGSTNIEPVGSTASTRGSTRYVCADCNSTTLVVPYDSSRFTSTGGDS